MIFRLLMTHLDDIIALSIGAVGAGVPIYFWCHIHKIHRHLREVAAGYGLPKDDPALPIIDELEQEIDQESTEIGTLRLALEAATQERDHLRSLLRPYVPEAVIRSWRLDDVA